MGPRYLGRKVLQAILTIVFVVILNFLLFRMMPGSPERILLRNPHLNQQTVAAARAKWGLDKPLLPIELSVDPPSLKVNLESQLVSYLESTASGDFGLSFQFRGKSVVDVISARFWPTIILIGLAEVIAIFVGLTLGSAAGWKRGGRLDRVGNGISLILYSMPYFVIGMPLIIIFAVQLGWFPTSGMFSPGARFQSPIDQLFDFMRHLVLPLATVSLGLIGGYSILMRSSIIETRGEDYVTTARAKGLTDRSVLRAHAFPNALLPTVTVIAINLGYVVAGAITAEIVFNWPGLGTLTVDALSNRDYPVLQGIFLLISVFVIVANLGADLIYGRLDPRVQG
jgi:peptide/nickel transport system permease protein